MRSIYGKGGTNHILENGLFCARFLVMEICIVYIVVMMRFPVAKSIQMHVVL